MLYILCYDHILQSVAYSVGSYDTSIFNDYLSEWFGSPYFMNMFTCKFVCACACRVACIHVEAKRQRTSSIVVPQVPCCFVFLFVCFRWDLSLALCSLSCQGWVTSKPQGNVHLYLPRTEIGGTYYYSWFSLGILGVELRSSISL